MKSSTARQTPRETSPRHGAVTGALTVALVYDTDTFHVTAAGAETVGHSQWHLAYTWSYAGVIDMWYLFYALYFTYCQTKKGD